MAEADSHLDARQQGRAELIRIGRSLLTGALAGWLLTQAPIPLLAQGAIGLLLVAFPTDSLSKSSIRVCVRVTGLTALIIAITSLINPSYPLFIQSAAWLFFAGFVAERDIKRT